MKHMNDKRDDLEEFGYILQLYLKYGPLLFIVIVGIAGLIDFILHRSCAGICLFLMCLLVIAILIPIGKLMGIFKRDK